MRVHRRGASLSAALVLIEPLYGVQIASPAPPAPPGRAPADVPTAASGVHDADASGSAPLVVASEAPVLTSSELAETN
jgi:hypothetical protein